MKLFFRLLFILCLISTVSYGQDNGLTPQKKETVDQADKLLDEKKFDEAIALLKSIEGQPKEAVYLLGYAYLEQEKYEQAGEFLVSVYNQDPTYRHTCFNLGYLLGASTDWSNDPNAYAIAHKTIAYFTEGLSYIQPDTVPDETLAQYYGYRGQTLQLLSEFEKAITDFNKAIELDPAGVYYTRRAMTYYFMGKNELACKDFEKGRELGETYVEEEVKKICP